MPISGSGWELQIRRLGIQRSGPLTRTYGSYQVFLDGQPLEGLSGNVCECPGLGENDTPGSDKRIEQGRYPLLTQFGARYRTVGYTPNVAVTEDEAPLPLPGLLVGDTGNRVAILIHPGHVPHLYLSSIGCLNLTRPLGAADEMDFLESRSRVIALIDALKVKSPQAFENEESTSLNAWLVIDGEPMNQLPEA
jgi:hypothetical protein